MGSKTSPERREHEGWDDLSPTFGITGLKTVSQDEVGALFLSIFTDSGFFKKNWLTNPVQGIKIVINYSLSWRLI
jgi:hypothetical protein